MKVRQADSVSANEVAQARSVANKEFRPDIEGLRAVAVVAVVLFHAHMPGVGGGFVGVDVFFVISGFLITGLLWREVSTTGTIGLGRFYGARARRLLPASATVGVLTMIASAILLPAVQARAVMDDGIYCALYVGNFWFITRGVNYFGHLPPSPFQHYWSLGVEEQFYLVWPAVIIGTAWLIRCARRARRRASGTRVPSSERPYLVVLALVAVFSFALSLLSTYLLTTTAFFSLPTRAWQLAAGGMIALTVGQWRRLSPRAAATAGWAGLGVILLACTQLSAATFYPGVAALLPVLGAALVIGAGCAASTQGCGRLLAISPMRAIGRVSYSLYLWHWPVLVLTPALLGHSVGLGGRLAEVLLSGALAVLTLRFVENPLRFAAPIRRSAVASLTLGGAATAVVVAVGMVLPQWITVPVPRGPAATPLTITAAPPLPGSSVDAYAAAVVHVFAQVQTAVAASEGIKTVPSNLSPPLAGGAANGKGNSPDSCLRSQFQGGQPECATGDTASPTTVALVGDSHAAMWNPAFQQIARQRPWRLEMMAKMGCPLIDVPITNRLFSRVVEHFRRCEQWRGEVMDRLRAERPRLVILSVWRGYRGGNENGWLSGFTPYDPAWIDSLTRLVRQLRSIGSQVLVLGPVPDPHSVVPLCLSSHLDDVTACTPSRSTAVNQPGIAAESAVTRAGGGQYTDLTELFCTVKRCPVIVGNTQVYLDDSHLTPEYSRQLAPVIGALADRALANN